MVVWDAADTSPDLGGQNVRKSFELAIHRETGRNFVPYLCQLVFAAILWVKLSEMFVTVTSLKHALLVS